MNYVICIHMYIMFFILFTRLCRDEEKLVYGQAHLKIKYYFWRANFSHQNSFFDVHLCHQLINTQRCSDMHYKYSEYLVR